MADVKYALDDNIKQNFLEPLHHLQTKDLKEVMVNSNYKFCSITHSISVILVCLQLILKEGILLVWRYSRNNAQTRNLIVISFLKMKYWIRKYSLSTEEII